MNMKVNIAGVEWNNPVIWIRRGICGVCGSEPDRCGDDKRSCEYSVGREPDSACGRDLWRNDECGRSAESGDRSVL